MAWIQNIKMQNGVLKMFITYKNYKGGINNLCVVSDVMGNYTTSLKWEAQAIKKLQKESEKNK